MPLLGKIVVIKRNGGDGTEFPLTASCLFGRKLDCDIRIQLPQVSKEHCKIELNENKELILTNLSSVNPTCINGQVINQSERLKHGDVITIIDRSFRFEYPPPKTPKKKPSTPGKDKAVQALQKQQEKGTPVPVDKRKSEHSFDTCLKDGSNLPPSVEQTVETEPEECKLKKDSMSPFCELYQMVKQDLAAKSPWKSELPKTPLARPQVGPKVLAADVKSSPIPVPTSSTKRRRSSKTNSEDTAEPAIPQSSVNANVEEKTTEDMPPVGSGTPSLMEKNITPVSQKKRTPLTTPQKFSAGEVAQQILLDPQPEEKTPKSPKRRRSGGSQNQSPARQIPSVQPQTPASEEKITEVKMSPRTSPRTNAGKRFQVQNTETADTMSADKQGDTSVDEPSDGNKPHKKVSALKSKKKRVSFGGQLSPELFDKCLPPNSPLRRGATPRRSLGLSQKPQSLLRRASTIGLMALRLAENFSEAQKSSPKRASPKQRASPAKTPSPGRKSPSTKAKTPSPAKRSPSTKAKTPSPKPQKSPSATPRTPASAKRASTSAIESLAETPRVQGRFSVSRISTPSPVQDQKEKPEPQSTIVDDVSQKCVTPKIPLRRKSMKSSARKTPKSTIKSALDVMRSRRSGASRANLKVLTSWADIVKFGQIKPQTEVTTKKTTKSTIVRKTAVPKPKTPARRLKNDISTGHAASPVTIVVGKAHMRTNQSVGAAPKLVKNIALFKKDMKMDEDLTGVAEIFKTPANTRSKNRVSVNNECPEVPMDEISVMKTPEESGEMIVSPLSVVSTAKRGCYNNEAVTRLLLDKDGSLLEEGLSQFPQTSNEASYHYAIPDVETPSDVHMEEEEATPEAIVKTPKQKAAPSLCLTGVKRLMKTPKQKAEPIEDLRGKLLKTPKERKPSQNESLEGVKEILKTPKYRGAPVEDMVGVKRVMQTPKEKSNPVLCAAGLQRLMRTPKEKIEQQEDLTGVKELMKTPKIKAAIGEKKLGLKRLMQTPKQKRTQGEEDLTGVQQLMKTPKHKGEQVEDQMGLQRLMQTPKEKVQHVEDLSGLKELMQTPKHKGDPISEISDLTKTPQLEAMAQDSTELKEIEPENSSSFTTEIGVTEPNETQESVENGSSSIPTEGLDEECDKENVCPVETMEIEVVQSVDVQCTAKEVESNQSDQDVETVIPQERHHEESVSVEATDVFSGAEEKTQELSEETVCVSDNTNTTVKATPASSTSEEEELIKSPPASKIQRGSRGRAAQKSKNEIAKAPAVLSLIEEEKQSSSIPASPTRGRRGKKLLEVPEVAASPLRKSARGRVPKHSFVEEEVKNTEASQVLAESVNTEIPDSLPVVTKTRKGRKAKQDDAVAVIVPTVDVNAVDPLCPEVSEEQVQAPVVKPGRRKKMDKVESQSSVELEQNPTEIVCEENAVASEDVITETVSATRARRGRPAKREPLRAEPTPALESEITSTHAVEVAEKPLTPVAKSGRGRKGKEIVKDQSLNDVTVSKTVSEADADNKEEPQTLVVKTGRGRKAKQQKPQMDEEVVDQPAVDTSAHLPVTEEHSETVVKSVRGNRKAKQSKVTISAEVEENIVSPVEQAETPVVRSGRKRGAIAKEPEMVADVSVKRGRRAVADPAPPVTVVSSRARKAAAKAEPEVTADVASLEEPVKPVKHTRRAAKAPESKKEENTMTQAESEQLQNTTVVTLEKVERSRRGKKTDSTKDIPKNPIKESATAEETDDMKLPKTVNWNPDLVACKDIETSTEVKEPQLKKPKRSGKLPAETVSKESNQAADLLPRGRRGRVAKEQEPLVEASQEEAHESIKPLRRGKAAAPSVTKSEATESKTTTPLKRKRNEVIEVADESISREPLPKRRGRVANSTEVAAEVSSKEKTSEAEPEKAEPAPKKTGSRAARGQKRTAQEPDPAPAKAQQSVTGTTTRKGRSVKKVEEAVVPAEAAPVRRTRRK